MKLITKEVLSIKHTNNLHNSEPVSSTPTALGSFQVVAL
jgi:hypothetical protein